LLSQCRKGRIHNRGKKRGNKKRTLVREEQGNPSHAAKQILGLTYKTRQREKKEIQAHPVKLFSTRVHQVKRQRAKKRNKEKGRQMPFSRPEKKEMPWVAGKKGKRGGPTAPWGGIPFKEQGPYNLNQLTPKKEKKKKNPGTALSSSRANHHREEKRTVKVRYVVL